jgi:CRP-like cAMP-binding protein
MGLSNPSYFLHAANILLLVAYSVRDILWLRLFAVAASLIALPYFILQPEPLWEPIMQILSIGAWTTVEIGERMLERGKSVEAISVIVRGKVRVTRDDRVFGELVAGHIVGSALLLSGVTADVDAVVVEPVRCMRWEVEPLDRYLAANPETRIVLQKYLARDLAGKMLAAAKL